MAMNDDETGPRHGPHDDDDEESARLEDNGDAVAHGGPAVSDSQGGPPPMTASEQRAQRRGRRRRIEELAKAMNMDDEETKRLLALIAELMPDPSKMSTAEHVGDRLKHALDDLRVRHPKLIFTRKTRSPLDITDRRRFFTDNPDFASLLDNEEDILRALMVNDRARAGYERWVDEHDAVRSMLLQELVKRQTLNEQWRHLLPKSMLPIYSMIFAAGVRAKDVQINSRLFNRMRDLLVEWSDGEVDKEKLSTAAERTEEEFISAIKADETDQGSPDDSFAGCKERLRTALAQACADIENLEASDAKYSVVAEARRRVDHLTRAVDYDAGLDVMGRLVFASVDSWIHARAPRGHGANLCEEHDVSRAPADHIRDSEFDSSTENQTEKQQEETLPPVDSKTLAFDPATLDQRPSENLQLRRISADLPRSTGLSRSTFDKPFTMWRPSIDPDPFCFMGFRLHPDLTAREGKEGPIAPVDLSRMEIGKGQWKAATLTGPSKVLGLSHPLMLPPHSRLSWYGEALGWPEDNIRALSAFGCPARPDTVIAEGDAVMLADAMRGVADLRLAELARNAPNHFLSHAERGAARRREAAEDLARYWIFVLLARHHQDGFDRLFDDGFFHGIHGPEFAVDASGQANFGSIDKCSHIGIWSPKIVRSMPDFTPSSPFVGYIGAGVISGIRRPRV